MEERERITWLINYSKNNWKLQPGQSRRDFRIGMAAPIIVIINYMIITTRVSATDDRIKDVFAGKGLGQFNEIEQTY